MILGPEAGQKQKTGELEEMRGMKQHEKSLPCHSYINPRRAALSVKSVVRVYRQ